jgi:hypothetical protein
MLTQNAASACNIAATVVGCLMVNWLFSEGVDCLLFGHQGLF